MVGYRDGEGTVRCRGGEGMVGYREVGDGMVQGWGGDGKV